MNGIRLRSGLSRSKLLLKKYSGYEWLRGQVWRVRNWYCLKFRGHFHGRIAQVGEMKQKATQSDIRKLTAQSLKGSEMSLVEAYKFKGKAKS